MKILVTGASGFIGSHLVKKLSSHNFDFECIGLVRAAGQPALSLNIRLVEGDITRPNKVLVDALEEADVVVHAAGYAKSPKRNGREVGPDIHIVNCDATYELARLAEKAGVCQFIFLSSAKVFGESEFLERPFRMSDLPKPETEYALSKWRAEQKLSELGEGGSMKIQIIRPPMVVGRFDDYKAGVLNRFIQMGLPLPIAGLTENLRSYVKVETLCQGIVDKITGSASDASLDSFKEKDDLSTRDLIQVIAAENGYRLRCFSFPPAVIRAALSVFGMKKAEASLFGFFRLEIDGT